MKRLEHGQALILIVFAIVGLIGVTAVTVDGGNAFVEKRRAQNAADTAALGGALARIRNNTSAWVAATYQIAADNGFNNDGATNVVVVNSPPISGTYKGNIEYIQVNITAYVPTYFGKVVGIQQTTVRVEAISRTKTPEIKEILHGNAVISLAPTSDCENNIAFWVGGEATLSITGSGIFVNSNNKDCALMEQGSGSIRIEGGEISVVGGASIQKPRLLTPYPPITGAQQVPYPPPFLMPKVNCGQEAVISEDGTTMTAGDWSDTFPPPGVHFLESGIYCLGGDFLLSGGDYLQGDGVLFLISKGRVQWNGGAQINVSAGGTGPLANLLMYMPIENHERIALNGNSESSVVGTILAPGGQIRIKGNDSSFGFHSQLIAYQIEADGNSNVIIKYIDEQNYDAMSMPEIQLTK